MNKKWRLFLGLIIIVLLGIKFYQKQFRGKSSVYAEGVGKPVDSLNGVIVYYNGEVGHVLERNVASDGYNIGLKYQCVEFVKRYYYEYLKHKMPDSYGHAKDFFDKSIDDGKINPKRDLIQFTNPSADKPKENDLIVFGATNFNPYGHVAIISKVDDNKIEIIQQNPGPNAPSRVQYKLIYKDNKWKLNNEKTLGWLRKK